MFLPSQDFHHDHRSPQGPRTRSQVQRVAHIMLRTQTEATEYKVDFKPDFVFLITEAYVRLNDISVKGKD